MGASSSRTERQQQQQQQQQQQSTAAYEEGDSSEVAKREAAVGASSRRAERQQQEKEETSLSFSRKRNMLIHFSISRRWELEAGRPRSNLLPNYCFDYFRTRIRTTFQHIFLILIDKSLPHGILETYQFSERTMASTPASKHSSAQTGK